MIGSRLAQHLPSLFGPSRRAAWRLSVLRRALAAAALLLAIDLAVGAARPSEATRPSTPSTPVSGATVVLPLATSADHVAPGSEVSVYAAGRGRPLTTKATLVEPVGGVDGRPRARVAVRPEDVGEIVQQLGAGQRIDFVLVELR